MFGIMGSKNLLYFYLLKTSFVLCLSGKEEIDYRLPKIYVPQHYQVHLNVSANAFTASGSEYSGNVVINFTVTEDTDQIRLHASHKTLVIERVVVSGMEIDSYTIDKVTDIFTVSYPLGFIADHYYLLTVNFSGSLTEDMRGFYKSSYRDDAGTTIYLAATHFEPTDARRAFPCFDEPSFKATFDISITYPLGYKALSNSPESVISNDSVSETIQFATTPLMSTYLLAFVVSDFTSNKAVAEDGVVYRVWSRDNTKDYRDWAVEVSPKTMAALSAFVNSSYSEVMTKMDQAAIPDFISGAMENWGLVTYREAALLWEFSDKIFVAKIITHEFSHQWFGNLVTLDWWSEIFLNEGFARYCQYFITNELFPEWHLDVEFMHVYSFAMYADSNEFANALESDVSSPAEIRRKFQDGISYNKGASIIRMVQHVLGKDSFTAGVRNYVNLNKFKNVVPTDLWNALSEKVDNSVAKLPAELPVVMQNWTVRAGYPVLEVTRSGSQVTIKQERFLLSGTNSDSTKWYVPITYTTSLDENKFAHTSPDVWLTPDDDLTITVPSETAWIVINEQSTGYYRVNYDKSLWVAIKQALSMEEFEGIHELNRAQLIDDLFSFCSANMVDYSELLDFLEYLEHETSLLPWQAAFNGFQNLEGVIGPNVDLKALILRLMTALYESALASEPKPDDYIYTVKRVLAADWSCRLGNQDCIQYALTSFAAFKNGGVRVDSDLKYIIYCNALRYGNDSSDYEFLLEIYQNASPAEQWRLAGSLACSPLQDIPQFLEHHLYKLVEDNTRIDPKLLESALSTILKQNPKMVDTVFRLLLDNNAYLSQRYGSSKPGKMLETIARQLVSPDHVAKLKEVILDDNLNEEFLLAVKSTLEVTETNLHWVDKFEDKVKGYLKLKNNRYILSL